MKPYLSLSSAPARRVSGLQARADQRGASLFVAIVALVLMTIAGLSLMRSVDTGNIISGNMAFRAGAVNVADTGVEAAATYLNSTISPSPDANLPAGCTIGVPGSAGPPAIAPVLGNCRYSSRIQPEDDNGLPLVNWTNTTNIPVTSLNGNATQFVVERLCNPDAALTITLGQAPKNDVAKSDCGITPIPNVGGSSKSGSIGPSHVVEVMYRVTVRTTGPRNTITTIQSIQGR